MSGVLCVRVCACVCGLSFEGGSLAVGPRLEQRGDTLYMHSQTE